MPRPLRIYLLACIVLAFGYLVAHLGEPIRLNVGDAWTDASVMNSLEVVAQHLTLFRILALLFSGLAAWLLFDYARRMWNDTVAIIATALTTTSLLWMMFADSIHRPPVEHAACFLALWGAVRALETEQRRHYLAAGVGTFVSLVAGTNDWLFLPLGVLFTIYVKRGSPFARGNLRVLAACAVGCVFAIALRSSFPVHLSPWQVALDARVASTFSALLRRYTMLLTPMVWITLAWAAWRAIRAASVKAAIEDGTTWMLLAALAFAYLPLPHTESATLRSQLVLPLYAIGSGLLIARLFESGRWLRRVFGVAWCVTAPVWGVWLMASHPREVLDRDDVARTSEYLAHNDRNSFVLSNLLADGPLVAAFGRHGWSDALSDPDVTSAHVRMLEIFEVTGTDYAHAIIFTTPGSRVVERSITQAMGRRMASADGWPYLVRGKVDRLIGVYDQRVMSTLQAVGATRVLHLTNFDVYRIDRATALATALRSLQVVQRIEFESPRALKHELLGWGDPLPRGESQTTSSSIAGYATCRNPIATSGPNRCPVVETPQGLDLLDVRGISRAELVVRVEQLCDQQLTITLEAPARIDVAFNGATVLTCGDPQWGAVSVSMRIAQRDVRQGLNIISLDDAQLEPKTFRPQIKSVELEPICEPPR